MDETRLVERLAAIGWKGDASVELGPGDDAAVLIGGLVVSTDMTVEGVHFSFEWIAPAEAGFRAAAAALSDMAAMGAVPEALLVSLALPAEDPALGEELQRGVRAAGDRTAAPIVGGDVSRSPGPVVIDVVAVGRVAHDVVKRGGARPGHDLWGVGRPRRSRRRCRRLVARRTSRTGGAGPVRPATGPHAAWHCARRAGACHLDDRHLGRTPGRRAAAGQRLGGGHPGA